MEEKLIEKISENPFLYDRSKKSYRNIKAKDKKWREIAADLVLPVETIKKRWVTLRDRYNREKKALINACESGDSSPKKEWKYFQIMRFMDDAPAKEMISRNFKHEISTFVAEDFEELMTKDEINIGDELIEPLLSITPCSSESASGSTFKSRQSIAADMNEDLHNSQNDVTEVFRIAKPQFQSSNQLFFASVASSIDEAQLSPELVSRIKLKVQRVIHQELYK